MEFIRFLLQFSWKHILIATIAGLICGSSNALLISIINREVHQGHYPDALIFFAVLAVFIIITSVVSQFMLIYLTQNAIYELRVKLSENILSSPLQHLELLKENRLIVILTEDVHTLTHAVSAIPNICIDFSTVIGCFIYLAWLNNALFVLSVASTVAAIWFVQTKLNKAQKLFFQAREQEDQLLKHFQAIITGIKELKLNRARRQEFLEDHLKDTATKLRLRNTKAMKSFALANGFGQMSQFVSLGFILFILPVLLDIPVAMLATYVLTSTFIALPMQNLLNRIPELIRGNVALGKIQRTKLSLSHISEFENSSLQWEMQTECHLEVQELVYLYPPEINHPHHPPHLSANGKNSQNPQNHPHPDANGQKPPHPQQKQGKTAQNGHHPQPNFNLPNNNNGHPPLFHPQNGQFLPPFPENGFHLGAFNISFKPGEITFIVGGNGSGKSTLAKLITGLYAPTSGEIYLNGQPVTPENLEWYRQHFSAIFSDFYLFESYLGFNHNNLDQQVQGYLQQLELDHKVQVNNGVLSTLNLSQGQRKRLALLTAYLEDRPIYVFDEWACDQEPRFRQLFYTQILPDLKAKRKTIIVITHDEHYFELADHLVKLDYGKLELDQLQSSSNNDLPLIM